MLAARKAEEAETLQLRRELKRLEEENLILRQAAAVFCARGRVTKAQTSGFAEFAFVSAERGNHAVTTLCRVVGASVGGFYTWLHAIPAV